MASGNDELSLSEVYQKLKDAFSCCKCSKIVDPPITQKSCGHIICQNCLNSALELRVTEWRCDSGVQCYRCLFRGINPIVLGAIMDEVYKLFKDLGKMSLTTARFTCTGCNRMVDITDLWGCSTCSIELICSKCLVNKCSHKTGSPRHCIMIDIEQTKSDFEQWRKAGFDKKMDALVLAICHLGYRVEATSGHLNTVGDDAAAFFQTCLQYFRGQVKSLGTEVDGVRAEMMNLSALLGNYEKLLPRLSSFSGFIKELDDRADQIAVRIKKTDSDFTNGIKNIQDWTNTRLMEESGESFGQAQ